MSVEIALLLCIGGLGFCVYAITSVRARTRHRREYEALVMGPIRTEMMRLLAEAERRRRDRP